MADDWKCAGCGIVSPGKIRICDCATGCVFKYENGKMVNELKIEHYNSVADLFELAADRRYSLEAIGIRVRNQLNEL